MGFDFQTCRVFNTAPTVKIKDDVIRIDNYTFVKDQIEVKKQEAYNMTAAKAVIDLSSVFTKASNSDKGVLCRLEVKVGVEGAASAVMANALSEKGFPLWIEFFIPKTHTADTVMGEIKSLVEANSTMGEKMFDVTVDIKVLTITAVKEYVRIKEANLYELSMYADEATLLAKGTITAGKNSFGTYSHLIKDLRLPSSANAAWANPNADEMPVVGALYDQYIIKQTSPAEHVGLQAVGEALTHKTTHVFWVNQTANFTELDTFMQSTTALED